MPNEEIASMIGFSFGIVCLCIMLWFTEKMGKRTVRWLLATSSVCFVAIFCIGYSLPNTPTKIFLMFMLIGLGGIAAFSLERLRQLKRRERRKKGS